MTSTSETAPRIIPRAEHNISRANISRNAVKVLYRLKDAGYQALLVGGGVRDLLLGLQPKDFDIATDASPEQVRDLFGNCRLIGRRFRLAHVRFRDEIIEVATFRGPGSGDMDGDDRRVLDEAGRILSDNSFGTLEEDAWRRDFTINALYYNIADFSLIDHVGGMADIMARQLRLIGDPETRYREDPVRMVRAARLAAKLGLSIAEDSAGPVARLASLIDAVPPARLFDEFLKVFQTGHALASYELLQRLGLFEHLFPLTAMWLGRDARAGGFIEAALANTDRRVAEGLPVTPMFLFAVFLWGPVRDRAAEIQAAEEISEIQALAIAAAELTELQVQRVALPRRFSVPMREMLQLQPRFVRRQGKRAQALLTHKRFRAAYDLLLLRAAAGEAPQDLADFWTEVQGQDEAEQRKSFGGGGSRRGGSGASRRRRRRPAQRDALGTSS
ncbi:MAG: polynucleotide adenylyltransferase PcnB [Chromatiales bacterium]|nr:polynucleotide adenylyltransferase PcnB [Chromatiales bacterium]